LSKEEVTKYTSVENYCIVQTKAHGCLVKWLSDKFLFTCMLSTEADIADYLELSSIV